jgi:Telomere resolvase
MGHWQKDISAMENTYVDERVSALTKDIEALTPYTATVRKKGKPNEATGWEALAVREAIALKAKYPDERNDDDSFKPESERTYGTCLRQITALKKGLKRAARHDLLDPANVHKFNTIVKLFGDALSFQFAQYKMAQNLEYRARVVERSTNENRIVVNLEPFLIRAVTVLEQCQAALAEPDLPQEIDWRSVSCALALTTGRRMSEIHCSGTFALVSEYEVSFKGQLKGKDSGVTVDSKGNEIRITKTEFASIKLMNPKAKFIPLIDHEFKIPTLVKAELVIAGIDWLEEQGKRIDRSSDPEVVNKRWGKPLSEQVKLVWAIAPDEEWKKVDPKDKLTYHKLRGAYFLGVMSSLNLSFSGMKQIASKVLGDRDLTAVDSYERLEIQPGTKSRI